jgi:hypothetical protein
MRLGGLGVLGMLSLGATSLGAQSTHALVVSGVSGEPAFAAQFARDVGVISGALTKRFGASAIVLTETSAPRSEKGSIATALQTITGKSKPGDQVLIVLIGHGSASNGEARFNIPGPDITATELARILEPLKERSVAVVIATSSSGAFLEPLAGANRVIVSATRSGSQSEEVVFAQHFAKALGEDVADINKDGAVSLNEAVEYTKREVARFYQTQNRIATEQATVSGGNANGFLLRASTSQAATDPAVAKLYEQRNQIQQRIDKLKARKSEMRAEVYEAELGQLLVELAQVDRAIRAAEAK